MAQRLVVVDDTDSNIQYSGPWFTAQNTQLNTGDFGPPFQNTLHGVSVDASFSYSFSGSSIAVIGTSITSNSSGSQDPTWECFVDNNSIGWKTVLQYAENNWPFCQKDQLQDGSHVLTVRVKVSNKNTFWFDGLQYNPSSNAQLDHAMLHIDSSDSALQYSSGWKELSGIVMMTQTAGSTVTYQFSGVSLTFFGFLPANFPLATSSATYSVDGQTPVSFLVPNGAKQLYNQALFQTGQLSAGQHKLVVTHQGNSGSAPLALDYFVVQNAPSSSGSSSSSPSGNAQSPAQGSAVSSGAAGSSTSVQGTTTNTPSSNPANSLLTAASGISSGVSTGVAGTASGSPVSSDNSAIGSAGSTTHQGTSDSSGSSTTGTKPPLGVIIGGVLGGLALLLLLLFLIFFIRKRNNRGAEPLSEKFEGPYTRDSNIVVNPFIGSPSDPTTALLSQNHTFEGQSLTPQSATNKLAQMRQFADGPSIPSTNMRPETPPTDASSSSVSGGERLLALSPLRNHTSSPESTSSGLPFGAMQPDGMMSKAREAEIGERPATPQGGDRFLRHEDSGVRLPPTTNNLVELPPLYTPG